MQTMYVDALITAWENMSYRRADIMNRVKLNMDWQWQNWWPRVRRTSSGTVGWVLCFDQWWYASSSSDRFGFNCEPRPTDPSVNLTMMYPTAYAWYAWRAGDLSYLDIVREICLWGPGYSLDGTNGPFLSATSEASRKVRREHWVFGQSAYGYAHKAIGG
jgi:hypothetical protein